MQKYVLNYMVSGETKRIGKFCGFDVSVKRESNILGSGGLPFIVLQHNKGLQHSAELTLESDMGSITRIENVLKIGIDKMLNNLNTQLLCESTGLVIDFWCSLLYNYFVRGAQQIEI